MNKQLEKLLEKYPFLAMIKYGDSEFICIIQNQDNNVTTIYDFGALKSQEHRRLFLELGESWWWESNRMIPINIFLFSEWKLFEYTSRSLITKNTNIISGHCVCLDNLTQKRTKRKSIQLVKKTS